MSANGSATETVKPVPVHASGNGIAPGILDGIGNAPLSIIAALSAVMEDVRSVGKDGRNESQKFNFRGIDAVVNAVGPALRRHGVVIVPAQIVDVNYRDVQTTTGKPTRECTLRVRYRAYGPGGDFIDIEAPGESLDSGDKGTAKSMSIAFRIALLQMFCIPTDEVDPDAHSYERAAPPQQQRQAAPPQMSDREAREIERNSAAAFRDEIKRLGRADLVRTREAALALLEVIFGEPAKPNATILDLANDWAEGTKRAADIVPNLPPPAKPAQTAAPETPDPDTADLTDPFGPDPE